MNIMNHEAASSRRQCLSYARSNVGHVRRANEDSFLDAREQGLWVVADGMGGHSKGDRASQTIIDRLLGFQADNATEQRLAEISDRLNQANKLCREIGRGRVMGSTVVAMYSDQRHVHILWAGDSRAYRLRGDQFEQLTVDHSLVQELCELGEITPEEAENHPSSNVITRAVGVHERLELDQVTHELLPGDRFLLCSDGLFKDVRFDEIRRKLSVPSPEQALDELIEQALNRGGTDNVTGIVVQMSY